MASLIYAALPCADYPLAPDAPANLAAPHRTEQLTGSARAMARDAYPRSARTARPWPSFAAHSRMCGCGRSHLLLRSRVPDQAGRSRTTQAAASVGRWKALLKAWPGCLTRRRTRHNGGLAGFRALNGSR